MSPQYLTRFLVKGKPRSHVGYAGFAVLRLAVKTEERPLHIAVPAPPDDGKEAAAKLAFCSSLYKPENLSSFAADLVT